MDVKNTRVRHQRKSKGIAKEGKNWNFLFAYGYKR